MKICIVSDSHDRGEMLAAAVARAREDGAAAVLHCGDVIGPGTLRPLLDLGLPVHVVHGNNLGDPAGMARLTAASAGLVRYHGQDADIQLGGRRIFMVHYPHYARAFACTGDYDLVCCGHSHRAAVTRQHNVTGGQTWVVNPGTVAGLSAPPTYAVGDLSSLTFSIRTLAAADLPG